MKHKQTWLHAILAIAIVGGFAGLSYLWNDAAGSWYMLLKKPVFQPPDQIFPYVWGALYLLTAGALFMLFRAGAGARAIYPLVLTLALGALWNYAFFGRQNPAAGVAVLALTVAANIYAVWQSYRIKPLYGFLILPLLIWQTYALVLNYTIYMMN